jgi:16S rRNA (cytosine967-C5)-methyltransferase
LTPLKEDGRDDIYQVEEIPQPLLDAGVGYMQDPATLRACDLLGVKPGHLVLDACAAPGGKTAYLAQQMGSEGKLIATDSHPARLERLRENLARLGANRVTSQLADWTQPVEGLPRLDRILLDVPCSNTGVLRRRVDLRWRLRPEVFGEMAALQLTLALNALQHLRPGGRAVYSTCSIEREENEAVVDQLLAKDPSLERKEVVSLLPHRDGVDGAFAALLVKRGK